MARYTKTEKTELIKKLRNLSAQRNQLEKQIKAVQHDLLLAKTEPEDVDELVVGNDGWGVKITHSVNWQSFDKARAAKEFSIEEFPEVYEPTYARVKTLLNKLAGRPEADGKLVAGYCGTKTNYTVVEPHA